MKKLQFLTALTLSAGPLSAQQTPNREGTGDTPNISPGIAPEAAPLLPGKDPGEIASDKNPDERFVRNAGKAGQMEVRNAELAITKASREDLKAFAVVLVKDHTAANTELAGIAKALGVDIPQEAHSAGPEKTTGSRLENAASGRPQSQTIPKDPSAEPAADRHHALKEKTGMEFDAAFMEVMEECHARDIALFEKAQGVVKTPSLKTFIDKTLPVLRSHATALAALERKDPNRPDAKTGSPAVSDPTRTGAGSNSPNRE